MYDISINRLRLKETETLDSIVDRVEVNVSVLGESFWMSIDLPDPDPNNYIALSELTDETVHSWVWDNINLDQVDDMLLSREKEKAESAIKEQDPETNVTSYKVKDHVKKWKIGKDYAVDDVLYYEWEEDVPTGEVDESGNAITRKEKRKKFYKVIKPHTSQEGWTPKDTASLFNEIKYYNNVDISGFPNWKQPQGTHDAYSKDSVVEYNGNYWQSETEGNTSEPPTNWKEYKHGAFPTWADKIIYSNGDIIAYNGIYYMSLAEHTSVKENTPDITPELYTEYDHSTQTTSIDWTAGTNYITGDVTVYNLTAYRALSDHTSVAGETPDVTTTLWEVNTYTSSEPTSYPLWKEKINYVSGDVVEYNGTNYIALADHTSVKGEEPDVNPTMWSVYTQ